MKFIVFKESPYINELNESCECVAQYSKKISQEFKAVHFRPISCESHD